MTSDAAIRDRVLQTAARIVLEQIFEAEFEDTAYGDRPRRGALTAVKEVHRYLIQAKADVVGADLSRHFNTNPHSYLFKSLAQRVVERNVLRLSKMCLRSPVEERDAHGTRCMSGMVTSPAPQNAPSSVYCLPTSTQTGSCSTFGRAARRKRSVLLSSPMPVISSSSVAAAPPRR